MKTQIIKRAILALLMAVAAATASAYDFEIDGIYYGKLSDGMSVVVTYKDSNYNSYSGSVKIPSQVTYNGTTYSVTYIGSYAFYGCSGLTSVTIPNSVTEIGWYAFSGCSGLTSVTIPNSVTDIGDLAFLSCHSLKEIIVESGNTIYDSRDNCNAIIKTATNTLIAGCKTTVIPNSVTEIGWYAFSGCTGLTSVTIPNSVTKIGSEAFRGCSGLTSVTIPNSVTEIGWYAFSGCSGLTSVTIPNSVTSIGDGAFYDCTGLTSVTIPNSVTEIGGWAFAYCSSLTSVTIPNSVTSIGESAFSGCTGLIKSAYPDNLSNPFSYGIVIAYPSDGVIDLDGTIYNTDKSVLYYAPLDITTLDIPGTVTTIRSKSFAKCSKLTTLTIPASVTSIGSEAFYGCSGLKKIIVENGNKAYDSRDNCNAIIETTTNTLIVGCKTTVIPNSVTSIGENAFYGCSGLTSLTIPNSVTSIGASAFNGCTGLIKSAYPDNLSNPFSYGIVIAYPSDGVADPDGTIYNADKSVLYYAPLDITALDIPSTVTTIRSKSFAKCSKLTTLTIPASVTSIWSNSFDGCSGLTSVTFNAKNCAIDSDWLPDSKSITKFEIGPEVGSIPNYLCYGLSNLTSITIPNTVTYIGNYAFYGCSGLTAVEIPNSITYIGTDAFYGTPFYNNQDDGLIYYGNVLYKYKGYMPSNTTITINDGTTCICSYAFYNCTGLISVVIPKSVTSIGSYAFSGCYNLQKSAYPSHLGNPFSYGASIQYPSDGIIESEGTIYDKEKTRLYFAPLNVTSVTIPNSVTSIGDYALRNCSDLTSVEIPNSIASIGSQAFAYCSGLTSVVIPSSVTTIGEYAFAVCSSLTSVRYDAKNCSVAYNWLYESKNITSFEIGSSVESIPNYLCYGLSKLTSVTIPNSVTSIGESAFSGCTNIESFRIGNSVESIQSSLFAGLTKLKSVTIGTSVTSIGSNTFADCKLAKVIWLPNTPPAGYRDVESNIHYVANDQYDFSNQIKYQFLSSMFTVDGTVFVPVSPSERTCDAIDCTYVPECKSIVIDGKVSNKGIEMSVVDIKPYTYYKNYNIENIAISINGGIGDYAFGECFNMAAATLGDEVTLIGNGAFYNCSALPGIVIPNSVKSLGASSFEKCSSLSSFAVPGSVASIGNNAFAGCVALSDFTIEDGENVLTLGSNGSSPLFVDCPLDEVYIGRKLSYDTAVERGYSPFYRNASLRTVEITDAETQIYDNEFYGCTNLQSLKIGDGVTTIGKWAFSGCSALEYFLVGNQVESIGQEAFSDCTGLTSFTSNAPVPPTCGNQALDDINKWECTLYVPAESIGQYKVADQWKDFFFIEESGIEDIVVDADTSDASVEYYNLQGIRVENPTTGVYIRRQGSSTTKVSIK